MKILFFFLLALPFAAISQIPINDKGTAEYMEIVTVDTASADVLYSRAKLFIGQSAASARDVVKVNDDATRTMVMKGIMDVYVKDPRGLQKYGYINLAVTLACKDNRFRYSITDIIYQPISRGVSSGPAKPIESEKIYNGIGAKKSTQDVKESVDKMIRDYINDMKKAMATNSTDW